ncbi:5,10-methylenetetrahydromethanopterin reductase [Rhodoligotrophos appendicifer]|uniref:LLM class flavin-dependent oxidoreductase n=1 Tax=Rhodoligotrophos appendicifer TaxID=987056 RepID=UPI001478604B|nr:LLM class flavin-dependent oxidoreductase [Rhodoligotrophos appendicifer]
MNPSLGLLLYSDGPLSELVNLARQSETLGYEYLWYTDVRFARECYVGLSAVAANTTKLKMGPGVTDPYSRHPAITAAAMATLDELSNGRAVLGLGSGGAGFRELGLERTLPIAAMRETVNMFKGLLRGETVTSQGKVVSLDGGKLSFKPVRDHIPVYFATHGPQMTKLAGEIADGVLIANTLQPAAFNFYVGKLMEGLAKAGRAPETLDIGLRVEACIDEDDEKAFTVMSRRVASRLLSQYPHWDYLDELGVTLPEEFVAMAQDRSLHDTAKAAKLLPPEVVESMVLAGNPKRVAEQLARALHPRVTQLTLRPHAVPGGTMASVVAAFAEQVYPSALQMRAAAEAA